MDLVTLGAALNGAKKQTEDYVDSHFKGGANIEIVDNPDGTQTIHASGEVSSTDTVAREAIVEHVQDEDNPHKVTKSQVGLGNVNNTADLDKPISTATQTALNSKANIADVYTKVEVDTLVDDIDVPTSLADLADDSTHRLVTDTEKVKINGLANIKTIGVGLNLDDATGELTATGGGTGGTTNYNDLSNKPQINSVTLSGNKSSADLGLADASDIPTALSDLTDNATHRTVTDTEKATWNNKSDFSGDYDDLTNKPTIPTTLAELTDDSAHRVVTDSEKDAWNAKADISDITVKGIKKNNDALTPDSNGIVNITVPTTAADVNALPDSTLYGASILLEINSSTYVVTATLKDQNGDTLGTAQTIDLPLESVVVSGSYNSTTKKVVLTLQNGSTIEFSVADLVDGLQSEITSTNKLNADLVDDSISANKFVTSAEKTAWNNKSDFSGNYNDLSNKPNIPDELSDLTEDSAHRTVTDTEKSTWNSKQSALSSTQLSAVNSGINNTKVAQIATNTSAILDLQNQIDSFDKTPTVDEVVNARNSSDGTAYTSLKNRLDTEHSDIKYDINNAIGYVPEFYQATLNGQGVESVTPMRVLSPLYYVKSGSTITVAEGYKFRAFEFTEAGVFVKALSNVEWVNTFTFGSSRYIKITVRHDNEYLNIKPEDMKDILSTNFPIPDMINPVFKIKELEEIKGDVYSQVNLYHRKQAEFGKFYTQTGEITSNTSWYITEKMAVESGKIYTYYGVVNAGTSPYSVYFDENGNFLSSFKQLFSGVHGKSIIPPDGAKFVSFSVFTEDVDNFSLVADFLDIAKKSETAPYNQYSLNKIGTGCENQIWSWWYSPICVSHKGVRDKLYYGFATADGYTGIASYDMQTGSTVKNILKKCEIDDHNSLAIHIFDNGKILVSYSGGHDEDNAMYIRMSSSPESIERFEEVIKLECASTTSYAQIIEYNHTLFLFYRVGHFTWCYRTSEDNGYTWSSEKELINATMLYYVKFTKTTVDGIVRMTMYSNPDQSAPEIRMGFLELSTGNMYKSYGSTSLGKTSQSYTVFDVIIPPETNKTQRLFDVAVTEPDKPLILYAPFTMSSNNDSVYKIYDNGETYTICNGGEALWNPKYQLGCAFINNNKIVSARGDFTGDFIEIYNYNNGSVTLEQTVYSEMRGTMPIRNARPIVDINQKAIVWQRGYYNPTAFIDFNTDAVIHKLI